MNLPNVLTISRILLSIILLFLLMQMTFIADCWAIIFFLVASLTDFYDGYFVRPTYIPCAPEKTYKASWVSYQDWIGEKAELTMKELKEKYE